MKTEIELEQIRSSKEFKNLIGESNKYYRQKEKLYKEKIRRLDKQLPLLDITEEINTASSLMNNKLDTALNLLKL